MRRRALLIGNGTFDDARISPLKSPVSDLERLQALLVMPEVGNYAVEQCFDCTAGSLRRSVQRFFDSAAPSDFLFVMVSGHGIKDSDGKLHFAARDTEFDALNATALEARFLHERMDRSTAGQKVLFLDTCYSGAFAKDFVSKGIAQSVTRDEFGDSQSRGKVVITASTAVQVAFERMTGALSQSRFTRYVIDGIENGRADRDGEGKVSVDELYEYVCEQLDAERAREPDAPPQNPQRWYFGLQGSVWLTRNPAPKPPEFVAQLSERLASDQPQVRALAVDELMTLVRAGERIGPVALAKLKELTDDDSNLVGASAARALKRLGPLAGAPVTDVPVAEAAEARWPEPKPEPRQSIDENRDGDLEPEDAAVREDEREDTDYPVHGLVWKDYSTRLALALLSIVVAIFVGLHFFSWQPSNDGSVDVAPQEMSSTDAQADPAATAVDAASSQPDAASATSNASDAFDATESDIKSETTDKSSESPNTSSTKPFDCRKAAMPLDWAICYDMIAFRLNTKMVRLWDELDRTIPADDRPAFVREHMNWILATQKKCGLPGKGRPRQAMLKQGEACVREAYSTRIAQIEDSSKK